MRLHKFHSVDAFIALDLDGAKVATGPVRWARRILQAGAQDLARSQTYTYASLRMRNSGASAGISADVSKRAEMVAAFVAEARESANSHTFLPDAAKGVSEQDLAPLRDADPRTVSRLGHFGARCDGLSAATAADTAVGLQGRTVVIEGLSSVSAAVAEEVSQRGASVVGVASTEGTLGAAKGLDTVALSQAWQAHGDKALSALAADAGGTIEPLNAIWGMGADVVFAGSKMGVVNHGVAEGLECKALVPCGRLAYTSKALAVCRRMGEVAIPDFVALAGATIAAWSNPDDSDNEVRHEVVAAVTALTAQALKSDDGAFLGACHAAESFLSTWQDELPFGRPLASY